MANSGQSLGYQGSETTGAEVIFYPQAGDPIVVNSAPVRFEGRSERDKSHSLVAVTTSKQLGAPSGSWSASFKPGSRKAGEDFFDQVTDDDWVDISFLRHARKWHVMRGLVGDIRRKRHVGGTGATVETYTLSGHDFGKIFETTPIWFNPHTNSGNAFKGNVATEVFGIAEIVGNPNTAVRGFLEGFMKNIQEDQMSKWEMPRGMPGTSAGPGTNIPDFLSSISFPELYEDIFGSVGVNQNYLMPTGMLWQLAKEWSDPLFNELFVDTVPASAADPTQGWTEDDTEMRVVFRNRPFPTLQGTADFHASSFPLHTVPQAQLIDNQTGKGGMERYNAFFAAPLLLQEVLKTSGIDIIKPLWDAGDTNRHGLRRFDVSTKYASADGQDLILSEAMRNVVRDWYCMNPYLLNGTLALREGRPEIQIGSRIRVPGLRGEQEDETFYAESVGHNWTFGPGTRSNIGVTRGWKGSDRSYINALSKITGRYTLGETTPSNVGGI